MEVPRPSTRRVSLVHADARELARRYGYLLNIPKPVASAEQEDAVVALEVAQLRLCGDAKACGQMTLDLYDAER